MKQTRVLILSIFLVGVFSAHCLAAELKVGYVNILKVFNDYKKTQDYDTQLEKEKAKHEQELKKKQSQIEQMQNKLAIMKEKEQDSQREKIAAAVKSYREDERQSFIDLKKERDEKMKEVLEDINKVVEQYAARNKYDLILNENIVLYGNANMEVTEDILGAVNKQYKK